MKKILIDTMPFAYKLTESPNGNGLMKVKGIFQRGGVVNLNEREYPIKLWEKILNDRKIQETISQRRMVGEIDHPTSGEMKLGNASHIITSLRLENDGTVIGEAEILNTVPGKHLQELLKSGLVPGISSRGAGSTVENAHGIEVVQEDFVLDTFDFVAVPSTPGAYPRIVLENLNKENINKGKETMADETNKFKGLRVEAQKLLNINTDFLTENDKNRLISESEDLTIELTKLTNEDSSYTELAGEVISDLREQRKTLSSKDAPPTLEKQVIAAGLIISESLEHIKVAEEEWRGKEADLVEQINTLKELKAVPLTKYQDVKEKLEATTILSEVAIMHIYVESILRDAKNAHLRPIKDVLENCKSIEEVNELIGKIESTRLKESVSSEDRNYLPFKGTTSTKTKEVKESVNGGSGNILAERAKRINKQLGHRF